MEKDLKDLLLKDLCARLPYGVKCQIDTGDADVYVDTLATITIDGCVCFMETIDTEDALEYDNIKPYLFPLSNMTEEQYKEWGDLAGEPLDEILTRNAKGEIMSTLEHHLLIAKSLTDSVNYCYKNHFDIYGLIPMGLANDATNLNIY